MKACLVNPDSHVVVVEQLEDAADEFGIGEEGVTPLPLPQHTLSNPPKKETFVPFLLIFVIFPFFEKIGFLQNVYLLNV